MKKSKDKPSPAQQQAAAVQALAAGMPHNANKASDFGHANALAATGYPILVRDVAAMKQRTK